MKLSLDRPPGRHRPFQPVFGWLAASTLLCFASAHQSLLFAHVTTRPAMPVAGEAFELRVHLTDSSHREVSDVNLVAQVDDDAETAVDEQAEDGTLPDRALALAEPLIAEPGSGEYRGRIAARPQGVYRLTLVEVVDGESESSAAGNLGVGGSSAVDLQLLLPPSGEGGLGTWLVWLVGLPLLAGLLVTVLVLTGRTQAEED